MNNLQHEFLKKFVDNLHTEDEHLRFIHWLKTAPEAEVMELLEKYGQILVMHGGKQPLQFPLSVQKVERRLDEFDSKTLQPVTVVVSLWHKINRVVAVAAALFFTVWGIYYVAKLDHTANRQEITQKANGALKNIVSPPGNKAVLTLGDGSTIILDSAQKGLLATLQSTNINKTADDQVAFHSAGPADNRYPVTFNTITTPRGGKYKIVLPDGSQVWMNAASSLKFPTLFTGTERRVELTGEAYFEITKNSSMPFKVVSRNLTVEVIGTHFNINSYTDEGSINTTLLEGSIKVSDSLSGQTRFLKPGQQAKVDRDIRIFNVDAEQYIAWKNGYFIFSREDIKSIMRKISRWYDVNVIYDDRITQEKFVGSISGFENISDVLNLLELTGAVHFRLEGKTVVVMY